MVSHSLAWHMEGCSCGHEPQVMTPLAYLTLCVRTRFEKHQRLSGFSRKENVNSAAFRNTEIVMKWLEGDLAYPIGGQREPILCRYRYPTGVNMHPDFENQFMRTGFYQLKFKSPYTKADYNGNEHLQLQAVFARIDEGVDFESELFYSHWHGTLAECPCDDIPKYIDAWGEDGEGTIEVRDSAMVRTEDNKSALKLGHTSNNDKQPHLRLFSAGEWDIDLEKPTLLMESYRNPLSDVVYERITEFGQPTQRQNTPYGRRFLLLIPNSKVKEIQDFLPPQNEEIRAWGSKDRFPYRQSEEKIHVIFGRYNTMAARVFNDIHQKYDGTGRPYELGNKLNLQVIDAENGDVKQHLGNDSVIRLSEKSVNIRITKTRGGRLQPLLIYRVRVHAPVTGVEKSNVTLEQRELESGGFELIIHAENKICVNLGFTGLRHGVTCIDIQELKSTNRERELSHCSLHLEV